MSNKVVEKYGQFTAASMVVGIVIGSGIFFRADDILAATGGSVLQGVLGFILVGTGVIFGALVVSEYAARNSQEGGMIAYSKQAYGRKYSYMVGWFMTTVYFPALIVILAWVASTYVLVLFDLENGLWFLTVVFIAIAYLTNYFSAKFGGWVQVTATIIKLIPLIVIGTYGLLFGDAATLSMQGTIDPNTGSAGFLVALVSIAFAYDGWIVATSISAEVKNSKQNLPRALVFGTLGIMFIYVLYFFGMSNLLGAETIVEMGDAHVYAAAEQVFGPAGANIMLTFVIVSVYGGLNGMTLGYFRLPHALVENGLMKDNDKLKIQKIDEKTGLSKGSILMGLPFVVFFFGLHYLSIETSSWFNTIGFEIDSMPVTFNYIIYISLYIGVIRWIRNGEVRKRVLIYIIIAVAIACIVIYGSLLNNGAIYIAMSLMFIAIGLPFYNKAGNTEESKN